MKHANKFKLLAICSTLPIIGSAIIPIVSCGPQDPVVEDITITFNAGPNCIVVETGTPTMEMVIQKNTKWADIENAPRAYSNDDERFVYWTLDGENEIEQTYILKQGDVLIAKYVEHTHEFDHYTVEEQEKNDGSIKRRIKGFCSDCQKYFELSDDQLQELSGRFLIKNNDNTYRLSDDGETISGLVQSTQLTDLYIYPICGTYTISVDRSGTTPVNLHLYGVHNYEGNRISWLNSYNNETPYTEKIYGALNVNITIDDMVLIGKTDGNKTWQGGIQAAQLNCNNCYLVGQMATYSPINTFKYCQFDSTDIQHKPDYSVYCYNQKVLFDTCSFTSNGKAIKIYKHGAISDTCYEVYDCTFTIEDRQTTEDKAAVEIDPTHQTEENPYLVYIDGCLIDSTYIKGVYAIEDEQTTKVNLHYNEGRKKS